MKWMLDALETENLMFLCMYNYKLTLEDGNPYLLFI